MQSPPISRYFQTHSQTINNPGTTTAAPITHKATTIPLKTPTLNGAAAPVNCTGGLVVVPLLAAVEVGTTLLVVLVAVGAGPPLIWVAVCVGVGKATVAL